MATKFAIYEGAKIPISDGDSVADIKEAVAVFYPEVANYEVYFDADGNANFRAVGGTKGI